MNRTCKAAVAALITVSFTGPVAAGPVEDATAAVAAYQRGDYATVLRLMRPLAERGNAHAQTQLGFMYADGQGVPQDYATATNWFRKAAEQGEPDAQNSLGFMYAKGQGVAPDLAAARSWWSKAAVQGQADAEYNLGSCISGARASHRTMRQG
jgi:uncharacterized protein